MTLEIFVSREARLDIGEAVSNYGNISNALSRRFIAELERVYADVSAHPQMYPVVYKNFRRGLLRKFPYSVFYVVEEAFVLIVGVVHQSRHESTWMRRA